jgi:DNA-binding transcriptional ArsR family regulator
LPGARGRCAVKKLDKGFRVFYYSGKWSNRRKAMEPRDKLRLQLKAEVFKAMGHPLRLGIIEFLKDGEKCVCEIVEQVGTEISNVSKHLAILKKAGIVLDRRDGMKIMYSLTMPCALDFARCVEGVVIRRLEDQHGVMVA